ncbi:Lrp/AsnC family transcriptional regulator [Halanaerobium praevalens]|uniref:siroheme decarboxylase n=1 Tax=Halanaerobium praevalens (strain ATCC 33744 / DSM 2228 / GSL) TaxID=572479 RepID=E3DMX4_HALPG|nr:Lrp/AsnC family transcriptional regulator [Halanaerobium praevalens]ADO77463.1 putative transcriptional regulator, AsnC family [Halanaerobium praevalens DSM 2228]
MNKKLVDKLDKQIIKAFEKDIPLTLNPYQEIAANLNIEKDELLKRLKKLKEKKILKRVSAILHHRDSGYRANGMFVCDFKEENISQYGKEISKLDSVSHCYQRKKYQNWPYNFYAMMHAQDKLSLETKISKLAIKYKIKDYQILYSTEELKKTSMQYFIHDFDI